MRSDTGRVLRGRGALNDLPSRGRRQVVLGWSALGLCASCYGGRTFNYTSIHAARGGLSIESPGRVHGHGSLVAGQFGHVSPRGLGFTLGLNGMGVSLLQDHPQYGNDRYRYWIGQLAMRLHLWGWFYPPREEYSPAVNHTHMNLLATPRMHRHEAFYYTAAAQLTGVGVLVHVTPLAWSNGLYRGPAGTERRSDLNPFGELGLFGFIQYPRRGFGASVELQVGAGYSDFEQWYGFLRLDLMLLGFRERRP